MSDRCKFIVSLFVMLGIVAGWLFLATTYLEAGYLAGGITMAGSSIIIAGWLYYVARKNL